MLRIDRKEKALKRLEQKTLQDVALKERSDIQRMIVRSPDEFFEEMGESLLLLGEEVRPADFVDDRIDLLALDTAGATVVIEIKRGNHKFQLLQALSYASMIAKWEGSRLFALRSQLAKISEEKAEEEIAEFLEDFEAENLNQIQRIVLLAEAFDYEVLTTAEWLTEKYEVDIRCYRMSLSADGQNEFLSCVCVYPPSELTEHAIRRRGGSPGVKALKWTDWETALASIDKGIADFYRGELAAGRENYLRRRALFWRTGGKRRWWMKANSGALYVWQNGRFPNDVEFWRGKFGEGCDPQPVKDATCLRLFLYKAEECRKFNEIVGSELQKAVFSDADVLLESEAEA